MADGYLTATELARLVGVSERTVRAWLKAGKLPGARKIRPPREAARWQIPEGAAMGLRNVPEPPGDRLAEIEARLVAIEARLDGRTARPALPLPERIPEPTRPLRSTPTGLPAGLVSVAAWSRAHGIPETTVIEAEKSGRLATIRGRWRVGSVYVTRALDAAGHAQARRLWGERDTFTACPDCAG